MNWYRLLLAQVRGPRHDKETYLSYGHDEGWHIPREAWEDNAIWVFDAGRLQSITAGQWIDSGKDLEDFDHTIVVGRKRFEFEGRYDVQTNVISISESSIGQRIPSLLIRQLERQWPSAEIVNFSTAIV